MLSNGRRSHFRRGGIWFALTTLLLTGLLACGSQTAQSGTGNSTSSRPKQTAPAIVRQIPLPTAKPIPAQVFTQHMLQAVVVDGVAYVGTVANAIYALQTSDGKLLWRANLDGSVNEPAVVSDGMVYVSTYAGQNGPANIHALQISDGKQVWEYH